MLLDIVEVAKSHTGENLASAFAKILEDYGISDKVRISIVMIIIIILLKDLLDTRHYLRQRFG